MRFFYEGFSVIKVCGLGGSFAVQLMVLVLSWMVITSYVDRK
jgi:hypothetical protein